MRFLLFVPLAASSALLGSVLVLGCGSSGDSTPPGSDAKDSGAADVGLSTWTLDSAVDDAPAWEDVSATTDSGWSLADGGYTLADGASIPADRFVTRVVTFTPGACAGFGIAEMPGVVQGPPAGGGDNQGSLDVVSLGNGGEIVVSFDPNAIVDGPGVDFIVFENAFTYGSGKLYAEPGLVSVSDDGVTWTDFPCTKTFTDSAPFGSCAGWHPVYSTPTNGISPLDPAVAGGDPFDLADIGVAHARFVRIKDMSVESCPEAGPKPNADGFDLDAISLVNAALPR